MSRGGGALASAAPGDDPLIDHSLKGNIHLVKHDDKDGLSAPNGKENNGLTGKKLGGIKFQLSKITKNADGSAIDFKTNEGLKKAAELHGPTVAKDAAKYGVQKVGGEATTKADGKIDWNGLDLGAYLLEETNSKASDGTVYKGAAPSIVFLPTTNPDTQSGWLMEADCSAYAVWVYPKNSEDTNLKTVQDNNKNTADQITYQVESTIPAVQKDKDGKYNLVDYNFYDQLDPKLKFVDGSVSLKAGDDTLVAGTDFQVKAYPGEGGKGEKLYVYVTESGRQKIAAAKDKNSAAKATMSFDAKVLASGLIPNKAKVFKNTGEGKGETTPPGDTPPTPPTPSEETNIVVSGWGKIKVEKKDEKGTKLEGAEFKVYKKGADGKPAGKPISVNGKTTFTTDSEGTVTIDGLHVNDYASDSVEIGDQVAEYVLVETKAPAGYELIGEPIPFTVTVNNIQKVKTKQVAGETVEKSVEEISCTPENCDADQGTTLSLSKEVINIKGKPKLPLTGGVGVAMFGVIGLFAIAGGGLWATRKAGAKS